MTRASRKLIVGQGAQGSQGVAGVGSQGSQGDVGAVGAQGFQGSDGNIGAQGFQGEIGAQGFQGAVGAVGSTGSAGAQGYQGTQGYQGAVGATGVQGSVGSQGADGSNGTQGSQGFQGSDGNTGAAGAQGDQGFQGAQGAQGSHDDAPHTGDVTGVTTLTIANGAVHPSMLSNEFKTIIALGAGVNVNWAAGQVFTKSLTAAPTYTFSNLHVGVKFIETTGDYSPVFPSGFTYVGGERAATGTTVYQVVCTNASTPSGYYSIYKDES